MARRNEGPWFRASKDAWYLTVNGKSVSLKVKGEKNEKQAIEAWHRLMANPMPQEAPLKAKKAPLKVKGASTVKDIVDAFLNDAKGRVQGNTFASYEGLLDMVKDAFGEEEASALAPAKILAYCNRRGWGQAHRHNFLGSIKSVFKWAEENGIAINPIKGLKRPSMPSRGSKASVSPEDHERLLEASTPSFRLMLTLLRETGARPSELSRLTAKDIDFEAGVILLMEHKVAHKTGKPRIIVLTEKAIDILKEKASVYPDGPLLRNSRKTSWTKNAIVLAMRRASNKAGVKAIAYGYRHAYATDALANGIPDATVAALLGHSGTCMLHKHYSHLTSRMQALKDALGKVR